MLPVILEKLIDLDSVTFSWRVIFIQFTAVYLMTMSQLVMNPVIIVSTKLLIQGLYTGMILM